MLIYLVAARLGQQHMVFLCVLLTNSKMLRGLQAGSTRVSCGHSCMDVTEHPGPESK